MGTIGTRAQWQSFLTGKGMTLTRYTKLSIPDKAALYKEYQGKTRKGAKPPQSSKTAPGKDASTGEQILVNV